MIEHSPLPDLPADFALLVNSRPEKGFGLVLEVAALCPKIPFVCIASQSDPAAAQAAVAEAGVDNVTIIPRTDDMDSLYSGARVALVPSYRFVETFSRVCIEAHRHARPVIGCDVGNVPNLLKQSGTVLPEDPVAWAAELTRLYEDEAHYRAQSALAAENSDRYSQRAQRRDLTRIFDFARAPMLIGVGSGLGNMLHVGPMIRNIARRLGHRVDIVVAEDHANSIFLLHNPDYVNAVYALSPAVLDRHYDTVFLTHSFGSARVRFSADRVLWSRDWQLFQPGHTAHETIFNLDAAKALLGVDYAPDDIHGHYISDFDHVWQDGMTVGIHGGSKGGYWASKRWPGFPDLVTALRARGFRVLSFGIPEEYVPGAEDATGGTIAEMADRMRTCAYFVSNDSGPMNIANALGIPVLGIFGPTDVATRRPLARWSETVSVTKDCAPCEVTDKARFKSGACTCIDEIPLTAVLEAFDRLRHRVRSAHGVGTPSAKAG